MSLAPDDPRHGTANGYGNQKCRCEPCRVAWRVYVRKYVRAYAKRNPRTNGRHVSEPGRFYVTSLTGWSGDGGNGSRWGTSYQVLDTHYCRRLMFETTKRSAAERVAADLNEGRIGYLNDLRSRQGLERLMPA